MDWIGCVMAGIGVLSFLSYTVWAAVDSARLAKRLRRSGIELFIRDHEGLCGVWAVVVLLLIVGGAALAMR